jgi:hypothetical protein
VDEASPAGKGVVLLDVPKIEGGMAEMVEICGRQLEEKLKAVAR